MERQYVSIDFDAFPFVNGVIMIPSDHVWFRSCEKNVPFLSDHVSYFGPIDTALCYVRGRTLHAFENKRPLRLLDMRFVQAVLNNVFQNIDVWDASVLSTWKRIALALGICTLRTQLDLLIDVQSASTHPQNVQGAVDAMRHALDTNQFPDWVNAMEPQGGRAGVTDLDYEVAVILKDVFGKMCDGIMSPRMRSMYHYDTAHSLRPEVLVFSPKDVFVQVPDGQIGLGSVKMDDILAAQTTRSVGMRLKSQVHAVVLVGGGLKSRKVKSLRDKVELGNKRALKHVANVRATATCVVQKTHEYLSFLWPRRVNGNDVAIGGGAVTLGVAPLSHDPTLTSYVTHAQVTLG